MRALALAVVLALLAPASSRAAPGAVPPGLADRIARDGRAAVIVELAEPALPEGWLGPDRARDQRRRVVGAQIEAIYGLAGTDAGPARPYPVIPFLALEIGPSALLALEASPFVRAVRPSVAHAPTLDFTVPVVQGDQAQAIGFDGTGQTVVVLDSGTDGGHQNFPPGKLVTEACFATGANGVGLPQGGGGDCPGGGDTAFGAGAAIPCDYHANCFHGTHVAGIAVGDGPQRSGVAPGASLIPIQVFSQFPASYPKCGGTSCPLSFDSDQDAALLYTYNTLRLSHDIASVNMSLGSGVYTATCDGAAASTKAAIDQLRSVGIATVIATGNNDCGGTGCRDAINAPACISSAVSVSAQTDDFFILGFANAATFMSLFAPGHTVAAPLYNTVSSYTYASGTSMAAPHVAGAWAILRQAVPGASVSTLLAALQDSGRPVWMGLNGIQIRDALGELGFTHCNDGIDNDGDGAVDLLDPGCDDAADLLETSALLPCDDGDDNDFDGDVDTADPGCFDGSWPTEAPACNDGEDNDGDGGIDYDGTPADLQCSHPHRLSEAPKSACGVGPELVLLLLPLAWLRRRRSR